MAKPFFHRLGLDPVYVTFEDILPDPSTADRIRERAVYKGLIHKLPQFLNVNGHVNKTIREQVESRLHPMRPQAWAGRLAAGDFQELLDAFLDFKADFRRNLEACEAYALINCCAALIAQILFVDNCFKEGLEEVSHPENQETIIRLAHYIRDHYAVSQVPIREDDARFYATYFVVQTVFDKIFVGDEDIVSYDPETGQVYLTDNYDFYTAYLEVANSKLVTASDIEKTLCYELTTGWGDGIDAATWNALNRDYYSRSEDNFFSADYDEHLDKMLPQFPYGRARAAGNIIGAWDGVQPFNLIEIGAGSGAFAVDLFMALKMQGKDRTRLSYRGLEPSEEMKEVYRQNFLNRTGRSPLADWQIDTAGLEEFLEDYNRYLLNDVTNVIVFSYAAHHCYRPSLHRLIEDPAIQEQVEKIYILDATLEHGWTKVYYMPLDCRSPEDFRNITLTGDWHSQTLWHEPFKPLEHYAVSRAWCALRQLTPPKKA